MAGSVGEVGVDAVVVTAVGGGMGVVTEGVEVTTSSTNPVVEVDRDGLPASV